MDLDVEPGTDPRRRRRERRRQVHADEDPRRRGPARPRRDPGRRRAGHVRLAAGRPARRHRHRLPGAEPLPRALDPRQPVPRSAADPARPRRPPARCASARAPCSRASASPPTRDTLVGDLDLDERQLVEISRVLVERPRLLILDEPNSALNERETERLFAVLRELRADGITILYVSHRLEEVFEIADRITVMRNGALVLTRDRAGADHARGRRGDGRHGARPSCSRRVAPRHDGRRRATADAARRARASPSATSCATSRSRPDRARSSASPASRARASRPCSASCSARAARRRARSASRTAGGCRDSPTAAARRGISLVPADRRNQGLMLDRSVVRNITLVAVGRRCARSPWLRPGAMLRAARRQIDRLRIKVGRPAGARRQPVGRQPAEGRRRPLAGGRAPRCCCSTTRRAASTSAPSARSTCSSASSPTRAASSCSAPPSCPSSSAWPTASSSSTGAG